MDRAEFQRRTKAFALEVIRFVESLPRGRTTDVIGRQLLRSGTSVGANYRAASRARSAQDMIAKLGIVEEEADESLFWLELLAELHSGEPDRIRHLMDEGNQLLAMTVASRKTLRQRAASPNRQSKIVNRQSGGAS